MVRLVSICWVGQRFNLAWDRICYLALRLGEDKSLFITKCCSAGEAETGKKKKGTSGDGGCAPEAKVEGMVVEMSGGNGLSACTGGVRASMTAAAEPSAVIAQGGPQLA